MKSQFEGGEFLLNLFLSPNAAPTVRGGDHCCASVVWLQNTAVERCGKASLLLSAVKTVTTDTLSLPLTFSLSLTRSFLSFLLLNTFVQLNNYVNMA